MPKASWDDFKSLKMAQGTQGGQVTSSCQSRWKEQHGCILTKCLENAEFNMQRKQIVGIGVDGGVDHVCRMNHISFALT